jgi:hypothetical protein
MSTDAPPYLEKLSTEQRAKLLEFIDRAEAITGDHSFDCDDTWMDARLMPLSLRAAQVLGYTGWRLEELFCAEFGIAGVTEGQLGEWLDVAMMFDVERRILIAAGGRN